MITSWTTNPGANTGVSTRLEVIREAAEGATPHTVVAESALQTNIPAHNTTAFPTSIPVQAGDLIGLEIESPGGGFCVGQGPDFFQDQTVASTDPGPGKELPQIVAQTSWLMDVSATVESPKATTCGKTTIGKSSDALLSNLKRVNKCVLPVNATVSQLTVYLGHTSTKGQQLIKGIIYANSSGKPGALLGTSSQVTFTSENASGWYPLAFATPLKLAAGTYWIGIITGGSAKVGLERFDKVTNAQDVNTNSYAAGPSNPFGSFKTNSEQMSLYATYTASEEGCSTAQTLIFC